jgi:hypothetical protein
MEFSGDKGCGIRRLYQLGKKLMNTSKRRTLMYVDVPTKVSAMEFISSPETPKSQILISPLELNRIFDGFISERRVSDVSKMNRYDDKTLPLRENTIT